MKLTRFNRLRLIWQLLRPMRPDSVFSLGEHVLVSPERSHASGNPMLDLCRGRGTAPASPAAVVGFRGFLGLHQVEVEKVDGSKEWVDQRRLRVMLPFKPHEVLAATVARHPKIGLCGESNEQIRVRR